MSLRFVAKLAVGYLSISVALFLFLRFKILRGHYQLKARIENVLKGNKDPNGMTVE